MSSSTAPWQKTEWQLCVELELETSLPSFICQGVGRGSTEVKKGLMAVEMEDSSLSIYKKKIFVTLMNLKLYLEKKRSQGSSQHMFPLQKQQCIPLPANTGNKQKKNQLNQ